MTTPTSNDSAIRVSEGFRRATITQTTSDVDGSAGIRVELFTTVDGKEYRVFGYGLKKTDAKIARRLGAAWKHNAIGRETYKLQDINGRDYLSVMDLPLGRRLNADLKRVGF